MQGLIHDGESFEYQSLKDEYTDLKVDFIKNPKKRVKMMVRNSNSIGHGLDTHSSSYYFGYGKKEPCYFGHKSIFEKSHNKDDVYSKKKNIKKMWQSI